MARRADTDSSSSGSSALLLDELFTEGAPRFLDELYAFRGDAKLAALAARWYDDKRPFARSALLEYIDDGCDRPNHRPLVKRLFKRAEERGDGELLAHFLVAFDRMSKRRLVEVPRWNWSTRETTTAFVLLDATGVPRRIAERDKKGKDGHERFSRLTRLYLQRRALRCVRDIGRKDGARFASIVKAALLLYRDEHLGTSERLIDSWSLVHLCYWGSPVLDRDRSGVRLKDGERLADLRPAPLYPDHWKGRFVDLMEIGQFAPARTVRQWALAMLREHFSSELRAVELEGVLELLRSPHDEVQKLGAELLQSTIGFDKLPIRDWLSLLQIDNLDILPMICEAFEKHVTPSRLSFTQCIDLALLRPLPVAELGMRWVRERLLQGERALQTDEGKRELLRLANAAAESIRVAALDLITAQSKAWPELELEWLRDLVDSRHADVREKSLILLDGTPHAGSEGMWVALIESPHADVRDYLARKLEAYERLATPESLRHLYASSLLSIHRGSHTKPLVTRRIADRIVKRPSQASSLLPLLGAMLRSLRAPERRNALAAVARAAFEHPPLRASIEQTLPDLKLFPAEAQ